MEDYYLQKYNIKPCVVKLDRKQGFDWIINDKIRCHVTSSDKNEKLHTVIQQVNTNTFSISLKRGWSQKNHYDDGPQRKKEKRTFYYLYIFQCDIKQHAIPRFFK